MQIKKIIFFFLIINLLTLYSLGESDYRYYTVILDPAGDAEHTGRCIIDNFERGLTLQCVEKIQEIISRRAPYIKVILTRTAGDIVYDLQNACLANRINADLFVNLNFYYSEETKPTLYLYQFSYGNDFMANGSCGGLWLCSYDEAYLINKNKSIVLGQLCKKELSELAYQPFFSVVSSVDLPIKSLIGIVSPAIAIEAGLKSKDMWNCYCEPIAVSIIAMIDALGVV